MKTDLAITNARILDLESGVIGEPTVILISNGQIARIADDADLAGAERVDAAGGVVLPGFIDCHVHLMSVSTDLIGLEDVSTQYAAAYATRTLAGMLDRGFTTVRDVGGADHGLARAVEEGIVRGPRVLFGGKAISQTGGHGDMRPRGRTVSDDHPCHAGIGLVCDGVDAVRKGVRSMLRDGADHVKLMLSGGVASPTDRIDSTQYSDEEIVAAVEEAAAANRYVAGHAYTARAINRALDLGVRTIEHGNLLDESSVGHFVRNGGFYVPTIIATMSYLDEGGMDDLKPEAAAKVAHVAHAGLEALRIAHEGGVAIAFGTDLLGDVQERQLEEFALRARIQPILDVIRSATAVSARAIQREHDLGCVAEGYAADLLVFDGDVLGDIQTILRGPRIVVADGVVARG